MSQHSANGVYKDTSPGGLGPEDEREAGLARLRTAETVSMSPELFEKLYLSPQNKVSGELRKTFANPTPIALVGFLLSLTPLACDLMGWRGAGLFGAASIGVYFFQGGVLMLLAGILEWVLGNTFPAVVFTSFGGFWLSFAATLTPAFNTYGFYTTPDQHVSEGLATTGFNASLGFWLLFMGVLCFIYMICALRTNVVFVVIFLSLVVAFGLLAGAFFLQAADYAANAAAANRCLVVSSLLSPSTSEAEQAPSSPAWQAGTSSRPSSSPRSTSPSSSPSVTSPP
jgi:succinate-acetate transporter protein